MTGTTLDSKLQAIRDELPAVSQAAFFNTGSFGPLPRRAHEALVAEAGRELELGRMGMEAFQRARERAGALRQRYAELLACDVSEIALMHSTTEGVNLALAGIDWQAGDRLITASIEHPAGLNPSAVLASRRGVEVVSTDIGMPGIDAVASLEAALQGPGQGARAVVISHISFDTGVVVPIREMAEVAHRAGALMIVDGAQSVGMIPLDVPALGVDAYAGPGQKWLCGPSGTGVLYVATGSLERIHLTIAGYASGASAADLQSFALSPGAGRFEAISLHGPSLEALNASMEWLAGTEVGWPWAFDRIAALGQRCHSALAAVPGVSLIAPADEIVGLVSFVIGGVAPDVASQQLREEGFVIRHVPHPLACRVATGFYNTEDEIDRFASAVAALAEARSFPLSLTGYRPTPA